MKKALAALSSTPVSTEASVGAVERVKAAYLAGATDVHDAWVNGNGQSEADFGEAASDYIAALSALPTASERKCIICGEIIPPFALGPNCQSCFDATEPSGEVVQADPNLDALIGLLYREGTWSGVWFADKLLEAAERLTAFRAHRLARSGVGNVVASEALVRWEKMIRVGAKDIAERENEASSHCGPYGTETWQDYEQEVRENFEEIGKAYLALSTTEPVELQTDREKRLEAALCEIASCTSIGFGDVVDIARTALATAPEEGK